MEGLPPERNDDSGSLSWLTPDLKFIAKTFRPTQAHAKTAARGETILHRQSDISNTRAAIRQCKADSATVLTLRDLHQRGTATSVDDCIASQFTGGGDNLGLIDKLKADLNCVRPHALPHYDNVFGGADRQRFTL